MGTMAAPSRPLRLWFFCCGITAPFGAIHSLRITFHIIATALEGALLCLSTRQGTLRDCVAPRAEIASRTFSKPQPDMGRPRRP